MDLHQIDKDLRAEFAAKKINAEKLVSETYAKVNSNPAFKKLDNIERELVLEISKCKQKNETYKNLKQNLEIVREEKNKILAKLNIKPSDLKPKYECKFCLDTGFVNGKPCNCYKKRKNAELIKAFGLMVTSDLAFENFDTGICKNAKHAENLQKTAKILQKFAEKYPKIAKNNIIISGNTGVGKTYLTSCLANELMKKDIAVCFISSFDLNEAFLKYHTSFDGLKSSWLNPFIDVDVLFIDDLGTEPILKNVTKNYLYLVISERERFNRPTIITTNLKLDELNARYDERIYSRLCNKRNSALIFIDGEDLRLVK